ncbi:MAG: hypothetical protein VYC42_08960 [Pseudomonadota bacterium]|nr:hypothetical protein [Pseudomonadota bacterium]
MMSDLLLVFAIIVGLPAAAIWLLVSQIRTHRRVLREYEAHKAAMKAYAEAQDARFARGLQAFRDEMFADRTASTKRTSRRRAAAAAAGASTAGASAADAAHDDVFWLNADDGPFGDPLDCGSCDLRDVNYIGEWHHLTDE